MLEDNNNTTTKNTIVANAAYDNNIRYCYGDSYSQERKINLIIEGLEPRYTKALENISKENALAIVEFILNTITEINLSDNHKRNYISLLSQLSKFYDHKKSFKEMNREDILLFLVVILYIANNYYMTIFF